MPKEGDGKYVQVPLKLLKEMADTMGEMRRDLAVLKEKVLGPVDFKGPDDLENAARKVVKTHNFRTFGKEIVKLAQAGKL